MAFDNKPVLVFWEVTRACPLHCVHCRAEAIERPLPGELDTSEGMRLIDQIAAFGKPSPLIIFTGGDPIMRQDLPLLLAYASTKGIKFAVSPAASKYLTYSVLVGLKNTGASSISLSLDSASPKIHDSVRDMDGTYERTMDSLKYSIEIGLNVQVNTTVMQRNVSELPHIFDLIKRIGVKTWEVFFLIPMGRGSNVEEISPDVYEDVCNFLYDASQYGIVIRTVEAPFIRRVVRQRLDNDGYWNDSKYVKMKSELSALCGKPTSPSSIALKGTLDGDGILFISYDGTIYPGGFMPVGIGNIKQDSLTDVYATNGILRSIRAREFNGSCGQCKFKDICGGSRARSYAHYGDPLGSDPACIYSKV